MTEKIQSQVQAAEMGDLRRVIDMELRDKRAAVKFVNRDAGEREHEGG